MIGWTSKAAPHGPQSAGARHQEVTLMQGNRSDAPDSPGVSTITVPAQLTATIGDSALKSAASSGGDLDLVGIDQDGYLDLRERIEACWALSDLLSHEGDVEVPDGYAGLLAELAEYEADVIRSGI